MELYEFIKKIQLTFGEKLWDYFINNLFIGFQFMDLEYNIIVTNVSIAKIMKYPLNEYIGKNAVTDMIHPDFQNQFYDNILESSLKRGYTDPYLVKAVCKDQSHVILLSQGTLLYNENEPIGCFSIFCDRTEDLNIQKRLETTTKALFLITNETSQSKIKNKFEKIISKYNLTSTETTIAQKIYDGESGKEIADSMGVTIAAINAHRAKLRKKFNINNTNKNLYTFLHSLIG